MNIFNADLHIHSPHSIAVSQSLSLETMLKTSQDKGLHILGTGDILQPDWLTYMEKHLKKNADGSFSYKGLFFILQTEIEDEESVHEVVFFPDFASVREVQKKLDPYSKNIKGDWGGRPRVNLPPPELVDIVTDCGAIIGPAHAFTPFKAIFRQSRYKTLEECYQDAIKKVDFLELGLSANTDLADRIDTLKDITFLSNSDAHSQSPRSLGREFNKMELDNPSFEEVLLALQRKDGRKVTLNVGLHPKLGKYYNMFCGKCRRRVLFKKSKKKVEAVFNQYSVTDNFIVIYSHEPEKERKRYLNSVSEGKIVCPSCKEQTGKNYKVKLGVSERIEMISQYDTPQNPSHRPPYINAIPLYDIYRSLKGIKSTNSKTVNKAYAAAIQKLGPEYEILIDKSIEDIRTFDGDLADIIHAFRSDEIEYVPGGGGTYGHIQLDIDS